MSIVQQTATASPVIVNDAAIIWLNNEEIPNDLYFTLRYSVARKFEEFTSDTLDACLSYITNPPILGILLVLIVHNQFVDQLLLLSLPHVIGIYVIGEIHFKRWKNSKIRDVFPIDEETGIVEKLSNEFQEYFQKQWSIDLNVFQTNTGMQQAIGELTRQNAQFMWFQLLIKTLIQMVPNVKSKEDLLHQSFLAYADNPSVQKVIHEFKRAYVPNDAIRWCTRDSFIYRLVNRACHTLDITVMFSFRFLIRDIHLQLTKLSHEQQQQDLPKPFIVYRSGKI